MDSPWQRTAAEQAIALRQMGPHLVDLRQVFGDVKINPVKWTEMATPVKTQGRGPGSLESDETAGLDYLVMARTQVAKCLPDLFAAYRALPGLITSILGVPVFCSEDEGSINVNILRGVEGRYEMHLDSQPWTLLLFAGEYGLDHRGGELVVKHPLTGEARIKPSLGMGVLFDGSQLPHGVTPLRPAWKDTEPLRITIPMVFVDADKGDRRDPAMSGYLYGDQS